MTDAQILVVKPKSISAADKGKLSKAGVIVIEMDDPEAFKFVRAGVEMDSSGMFGAALKALNSCATSQGATMQREEFCRLILALYDGTTA